MKVLVGIGGGSDSVLALDAALERAREAGDDLTVAVVDNGSVETSLEALEARVRDRLEEAGMDAEVRVLEGHPGSSLVDLAEAEGFDRIVIGGGETSPMGKISLGSVTEFVLLNSHVTVTLVR